MDNFKVMCSSYSDLDVFVEKLEINALAFVYDKEQKESYACKIVDIYERSRHPREYDEYLRTEVYPFATSPDYEVEFITDNDCFMVAINKIRAEDFNVVAYC